MSRTYAHTPEWALALRADDAEVIHQGCEQDPSGQGRLVGYREVQRFVAPYWHAKHLNVTVDPIFGDTDDGIRWVYQSETYIVREPVYEVVPCDVDSGCRWDRMRSCYRHSDTSIVEAYGPHHKCEWPAGTKKSRWYGPERRQARDFGRRAAREYNTYGVAPEDEPYTPGSPSGLWGGGYID